MRFKIQLTIINPDDGKETTEEIVLLNKQNERLEDIERMILSRAKELVKIVKKYAAGKEVIQLSIAHYLEIYQCKAQDFILVIVSIINRKHLVH